MDSEWIDARVDGSDLRVGDGVRLVAGIYKGSAFSGTVSSFEANAVVLDHGASRKPSRYARDRVGDIYRWQYHAPTRAKLEAADRERVTVTSITDDTMTVQPAPPPDSEPGWDHVPAEYYDVGSRFSVGHGDKLIRPGGEWCAIRGPIHITYSCSEYWVRRASHPERVRWLEERARALNSPPSAVNVDSAIVDAVNSTATYARAPTNDAARPVVVPPDPFAAVRAEAKRMLDAGANPRDVLGALDSMVRSHSTGASVPPAEILTWQVHGRAHFRVAQTAATRRESPCYHGKRAGTCGWCALVHERSDSRAVAPHEPAWETADCEGE